MPRLVRNVALLTLGLLIGAGRGSAAPPADPGPAIQAELVGLGFENVAVRTGENSVRIWYENRILRYELAAIGLAARTAVRHLPPGTDLTLVIENRGVAVLSLSAAAGDWDRFLRGDLDPAAFNRRLALRAVADGSGSLAPPAGTPRANRRWWRTDLAVRPLFSFEIGIADDPFQIALYLAPEATMSPGYGTLATVQAQVRVTDDLDPYARRVAPGRNTLSWGGPLPGGVLFAGSAGYFPQNRYGVAAQAGRLFLDGRLEMRAGGDASGFLKFSRDLVFYSGLHTWSAYVSATGRTRGLDLEATVTGARFMEGALGARVDVDRRFAETTFGFFGIKTRDDSVAGLRLVVPLPPRRWSRPRAVRLTTVPEFPLTYRESVLNIGRQVSLFDNLDRLRKGLYPTFVRNNLADLRRALPGEERQ